MRLTIAAAALALLAAPAVDAAPVNGCDPDPVGVVDSFSYSLQGLTATVSMSAHMHGTVDCSGHDRGGISYTANTKVDRVGATIFSSTQSESFLDMTGSPVIAALSNSPSYTFVSTLTFAGAGDYLLTGAGYFVYSFDVFRSFTDFSTLPPVDVTQFQFSSTRVINFGITQYINIGNAPITHAPEPATYAMMLAGLGLLAFVARRRKQQAA